MNKQAANRMHDALIETVNVPFWKTKPQSLIELLEKLPRFHQQYPISSFLHMYLEPIPHYLYKLQNHFSDFPTENLQNQ